MTDEKLREFIAPPDLMASRRVLVVQPHPDDNEIGAGGIIAKLSAQGCEVYYLTVTTGDLGMPDPAMSSPEIAEIRAAEAQAAGRHLGVKGFYSLGLPDQMLQSEQEIAPMIVDIIREVKPDAVLCPDPWLAYECHSDHRKTGMAVAQAAMFSGSFSYPRGGVHQTWEVTAIGFYYTSNPNTVIDVTPYWDQKFEAISLHKSQIDEGTLSMFRGFFTLKSTQLAEGKGFALGEGLKLLRPFQLHCFVDAIDM